MIGTIKRLSLITILIAMLSLFACENDLINSPPGKYSIGLASNPSVSYTLTPPTYVTATISYTTNYESRSIIDYGTASGVYTSSLELDTTDATVFSRAIPGLTQGSTYYYRIKLFSNGYGNRFSGEYSFTASSETAPTLAQKLRGFWMVGGLSGAAITSTVTQIDLYDPVTGTFYGNAASTVGYTPVSFAGIESFTISSTDHRIYVMGGFSVTGSVLSLVQYYSIENNTWTTVTPIGGGGGNSRANIHAVKIYNKIYVVGGTTAAYNTNWTASATNYEYVPLSDTWVTRTAIAANVSERFAYVYGDMVYSLAGRNAHNTVAATPHDAYSVTAAALTGTGIVETAIPTGRTGVAGALWIPSNVTLPPRLILIGGITAIATGGTVGCFIGQNATGATFTTANYVYTLNAPFTAPSAWVAPTTTAYFNASTAFGSAVIIGDMMYYFGGTSGIPGAGQNTIYTLNLTTLPGGAWTTVSPTTMPTNRWGFTAVKIEQ